MIQNFLIILILLLITILLNFSYEKDTSPEISNFQNDYLLKATEDDIYINFIMQLLDYIKNNPEFLSEIFELFLTEDRIKSYLEKIFINEQDYKFLINIINSFKNNEIKDLIQIIKNNSEIIESIKYIIIDTNKTNVTVYKILNKIRNITIEYPEINEFIQKLLKNYPDLIYILRFLKKIKNIDSDILEEYLDSIKDSILIIYNFSIDILQNYKEEEKSLNEISNFIKNHTDLINSTLVFLQKQNFTEISIFFKNDNDFLSVFFFDYIDQEKYENIVQIFIDDKDVIIEFANCFSKAKKYRHLMVQIGIFLLNNEKIYSILGEIFTSYVKSKRNKNEIAVPFSLYAQLVRELIDIYVNQNLEIFENITEGCLAFLNYTLLGNINNKTENGTIDDQKIDKKIYSYYLYKLAIDTTKDKNDLISYENCLDHDPTFSDITNSEIKNYIEHQPNFIISIIDLTKRLNLIKNTTFYENYIYIFGVCLPQGKKSSNKTFPSKNGSEIHYYCEKTDYESLIKTILEIFEDTEGIKVNAIEINRENDNTVDLSWNYIIPFFILFIPIIIYLFLIIYRKIAIKKKKNVIMVNNIKNEEEEVEDDDNLPENNTNKEEDKNSRKKVKIVPKWYKILNEFFNFKENIKELFNFETSKTNINDIRGLNYINGLIGISIILTILGQLYLIFCNIPMKQFGTYQFYELISSFFYVLIFIGLRYSPRILFSCSGYTLTYKYLSYIERGSSCHLIKFFFYQLYKYLMIILFILNLRYSLFLILSLVSKISPMWLLFNEKELKEPEDNKLLILNLLNCYSVLDLYDAFFSEDSKSLYNHDLLDYFWMSFNEIFFFIFGIILISIGYKTHLRIDYIIIILIIIIFCLKIGLYLYYNNKKEIYTTLYYHLFEYGIIMINPFFNLSYFLIGMYFGLINYSLQNGIIDLYVQSNNYNRLDKNKEKDKASIEFLFKVSQNYNLYDNNDDNDNNDLDTNNSGRSKSFKVTKMEKTELIDRNKSEKNFIKRKSINDSADSLSQSNSEKDNNNNNKNNYIKELEVMPFLISAVYIIKWNKKENLKLFFTILIIILFSIIIIFSFSYKFFIIYYGYIIDKKQLNDNYGINDKLYEKYSLEGFISNPILNIIYLIDIEIVVLSIQLAFFILYMKGQYFINDFFSHIYWSFFTKSYFSFLMVCNPIILFMFYQSETLVKLNLLNIVLYFIINTVFIIIFIILVYIIIELPLKKIFKFIINRDMQSLKFIENTEEYEENEEAEEEKEYKNYLNNDALRTTI